MYININTDQALVLWTSGWCWNAIGKIKFKCSGETVKRRVGELRTSENNYLHQRRHKRCPLCYKFPADQQELI